MGQVDLFEKSPGACEFRAEYEVVTPQDEADFWRGVRDAADWKLHPLAQATVLPEGMTVTIREFFDPTTMDEPTLRVVANVRVGGGMGTQQLHVSCIASRDCSLEYIGNAVAKVVRKVGEAVVKYEAMTEEERAALAGGGEVV